MRANQNAGARPERDHLIRCRVSNGVDHAEEFSASDGHSLREGATRAWERLEAAGRHQIGSGPRAAPLRCILQVRPRALADTAAGWYAPCRVTPQGGAAYAEVFISRAILARRSPDDWNDIWEWVRASRGHDDALAEFTREVGDSIRRCGDAPAG